MSSIIIPTEMETTENLLPTSLDDVNKIDFQFLLKIASNNGSCEKDLFILSYLQDAEILYALIDNPIITSTILHNIVVNHSYSQHQTDVLQKLAQHEKICSPDLEKIYEPYMVLDETFNNSMTTTYSYTLTYYDQSNVSDKQEGYYAKKKLFQGMNNNGSSHNKMFKKIGKSSVIKTTVAQNVNASPQLLTKMFNNEQHFFVQKHVAENPNTPDEILTKILNTHKHKKIRMFALTNLRNKGYFLNYPDEWLEEMFNLVSIQV